MKKEITITQTVCDFCDLETNMVCTICEKDFCAKHGLCYATSQGAYSLYVGNLNRKIIWERTELYLCRDELEKAYPKGDIGQ